MSNRIKKKSLFSSLRNNTVFACRFYFHSVGTSLFLPKISRFINKYLYSMGLGSSLNRYDNSLTLYSSFADKKLYSCYAANDKFINFGSGAFFHKRWKNYDYLGNSSYYKAIQGIPGKDFNPIDLCDENLKVPEADNSVDLIYCSHTLEHLDEKSSHRFLKECCRILKKKGVLRVALPNTKNDFYLLHCLMRQNEVYEDIKKNYIENACFHILADTKTMKIKDLLKVLDKASFKSNEFYNLLVKEYPTMISFDGNNPERHINYWDFDNLIEVISEFGFKLTIPSYQGNSVARPFCNLHVFDNTEPQISFYADIIK
jgi:predicted SAM-dependent methyltransferase